MKKWIFWIICLLALFPMSSFAQSIWDIDVSFCNSWDFENQKFLTMITEAWKQDSVCVELKNNSDKDVSLHIDFVDWAVSDQWNSVCFDPDHLDKEFSKYVSNYEPIISLKWGEKIEKQYNLQYPIWFSWLSHGCFSYYLVNENDNDNEWVSLIFRKVNTIDILVWWVEVSSRIKIKDVFYTWDVYSQKLWFKIENNWNIDQEVTITWFLDWMFWYNEDFDLWSFKLDAGEDVVVYTTDLHLPNYKWLFKINAFISNEPKIDFSIAHSNIYNNEFSVAGTSLATTSFFLWNWWIIVLIILFMLLIIALIVRLKKNRK